MKFKIICLLLMALVVGVLSGCNQPKATTLAAPDVKVVETGVVSKHTIIQTSQLSGTLEASTITDVSFEVSGRVFKLNKQIGDTVEKGEHLGELDVADYQLAVQQAEAGIQQSQASLNKLNDGARSQEIEQAQLVVAKAQVNVNNAQDNLKRMKALYLSGAISKEEWNNTVTQADLAENDLKTAQSSLSMTLEGPRKEDKDQAQSQLSQQKTQEQQAQLNLQKTTLVSPISGTIIGKLASEGQVVNSMVLTPVYQIGDISELKVVLPVPDKEISGWSSGDQVTLDIYGNKRAGYVSKIYPSANSGTGTIGVEVHIDNEDKKWFVGQVVKTTHQVNQGSALLVPMEAVCSTGGDKPYVFAVTGNKVKKIAVQTGQLFGNQLEIRSGLTEGSVIVTRGADKLFDGDTINIGAGGEHS